MHTTPNPELDQTRNELRAAKAKFELTMLRVQTKALETLERLMDEPESSGDPKKDAEAARERNRQRLSATQTLIHCRTVQREQRLNQAQRWKRKDELAQRAAAKRRNLEVARSLHKDCPEAFPDPDAPEPPPSTPKGGVVRSEADGHENSPAQHSTPHGLRPIKDRTQTMPPI